MKEAIELAGASMAHARLYRAGPEILKIEEQAAFRLDRRQSGSLSVREPWAAGARGLAGLAPCRLPVLLPSFLDWDGWMPRRDAHGDAP